MAKGFFGGRKDEPAKVTDPEAPAVPTEPPVPPHHPADAGAGEGGHAGPVAGVAPDGGEAAPVAETTPPPKAERAAVPRVIATGGLPLKDKDQPAAAPQPKKFRVTLPGREAVTVEVSGAVTPADMPSAAVVEFQRVCGIWSLPCPPSVEPVEG